MKKKIYQFCKNLFLTTSILFGSASCTLFQEKISSKNLTQLKKIAILSDLGPILHFHYAGATSFKNRYQTISTDWNIDTLVNQTSLELLKNNTSYQLVEIQGNDFSKKPHFDQLIKAKKNGAKIDPFLAQLSKEGFDGLILIQAWRQKEDTNITPGYGIYYDNRLLIHDQFLYLTAKIRVYNTHKKMEVSSTDLLSEPYLDLKEFPKRKKYDEWSSSEIIQLKELLFKDVTKELPKSLKRLGLI